MINLIKIALARLGLYPASAALFASPLTSMARDLRDYEEKKHDEAAALVARSHVLVSRSHECRVESLEANSFANKLEEIIK